MDDSLNQVQRRAFYDALAQHPIPLITEARDYHDVRERYTRKVVRDALINLGVMESTAKYHAINQVGRPRERVEAALKAMRS